MKRLTVFCLSALLTGTTFTATSQKTLIPNNTEVFKLSLETHGSYNEALSGEAERDRFLLNDFKVEATGTVTPWPSSPGFPIPTVRCSVTGMNGCVPTDSVLISRMRG